MCAEAEGIFLWCLEGLRRLIANGYSFTLSERARGNMAEAVSDGNNVVDFMRSEGYIRFRADSEASSRDLYAVYRLWCEDNALKALSARSFSLYVCENLELYGLEQSNNIYLPAAAACAASWAWSCSSVRRESAAQSSRTCVRSYMKN